jgi:hypothetical protein
MKSILVLDNNSQSSSKIAGGLYNPVILKRLVKFGSSGTIVVMDFSICLRR